jgi:hypothetical protein
LFYYAFFILLILPHRLFPFDFPCDQDCLIEIVLELLSQNNEVENARRGFVFFATIGFFMPSLAREHILYVVSQEATTSGILLCRIAGRKQLTIAICKLSIP